MRVEFARFRRRFLGIAECDVRRVVLRFRGFPIWRVAYLKILVRVFLCVRGEFLVVLVRSAMTQ